MAEDGLWVWYTEAPLLPVFREADLARDFHTAQQRHMDVEERKVGRMRLDGGECGNAVAGLREYSQLRPQRLQQIRQFVGEQRLILREDRSGSGASFKRVRRAPSQSHSRRHSRARPRSPQTSAPVARG